MNTRVQLFVLFKFSVHLIFLRYEIILFFIFTVTGLYTYNTQFYVKGASHIFFNNITNNVSGANIGSGVGQTSIRDGSSYIIINNSVLPHQS